MKIRELLREDDTGDDATAISLKLSAVLNQIAGRVKDTGANSPVSLSAILNILEQQGLHFTEQQFREMYVNPPLNKIIANISGDDVTFIGQRKEASDAVKPDQSTDTLEKMAAKAIK